MIRAIRRFWLRLKVHEYDREIAYRRQQRAEFIATMQRLMRARQSALVKLDRLTR